jgi:hypothetical protein
MNIIWRSNLFWKRRIKLSEESLLFFNYTANTIFPHPQYRKLDLYTTIDEIRFRLDQISIDIYIYTIYYILFYILYLYRYLNLDLAL